MVEHPADLLLALEAGEEAGVALEPEQRYLQRNGTAALQIDHLEHRAHAAPADDVGDLEALVEDLTDLKLVGHRGWQRRVIRDGIREYPTRCTLSTRRICTEMLSSDGVFPPLPAGISARRPGWRHGDRVRACVCYVAVAVGALNDDVPAAQDGSRVVDLYRRILTDASRQHAPQLARHRVFLRDQAHLELHRHVGVIRRELTDLPLPHQMPRVRRGRSPLRCGGTARP